MFDKFWLFLIIPFLTAAAALLTLSALPMAQTTVLAPFQTNITVAATATMAALPANPSRKGLYFCNTSATSTVYLSFGTVTPSATAGIALPGGGVAGSCLNWVQYAGSGVSMGAQINVIGQAAGTAVALEF